MGENKIPSYLLIGSILVYLITFLLPVLTFEITIFDVALGIEEYSLLDLLDDEGSTAIIFAIMGLVLTTLSGLLVIIAGAPEISAIRGVQNKIRRPGFKIAKIMGLLSAFLSIFAVILIASIRSSYNELYSALIDDSTEFSSFAIGYYTLIIAISMSFIGSLLIKTKIASSIIDNSKEEDEISKTLDN